MTTLLFCHTNIEMHKADQPENNNLTSSVTVKDRTRFPVAILVVILEITSSGNRNKKL